MAFALVARLTGETTTNPKDIQLTAQINILVSMKIKLTKDN